MNVNDSKLLREIIMDHYQYPRNHELIEDEHYRSRHMASDSCIDDITVQCDIKDNIVKDIRFNGVACTIATSSTSIMTELLVGKSIEQCKEIINAYFLMIDTGTVDEEVLQEAIAMQGVGKQANRINCATIGWKAIREMIEESEKANES